MPFTNGCDPERLKPGARMPGTNLNDTDIEYLSTDLESLR